MFQIVERAVPPDIGRLLGGVSLLFTPFGLRGPPATISRVRDLHNYLITKSYNYITSCNDNNDYNYL